MDDGARTRARGANGEHRDRRPPPPSPPLPSPPLEARRGKILLVGSSPRLLLGSLPASYSFLRTSWLPSWTRSVQAAAAPDPGIGFCIRSCQHRSKIQGLSGGLLLFRRHRLHPGGAAGPGPHRSEGGSNRVGCPPLGVLRGGTHELRGPPFQGDRDAVLALHRLEGERCARAKIRSGSVSAIERNEDEGGSGQRGRGPPRRQVARTARPASCVWERPAV